MVGALAEGQRRRYHRSRLRGRRGRRRHSPRRRPGPGRTGVTARRSALAVRGRDPLGRLAHLPAPSRRPSGELGRSHRHRRGPARRRGTGAAASVQPRGRRLPLGGRRADTVPEMPRTWVELVRPVSLPRTSAPVRPGRGGRHEARLAGLLRALEQAPEGRRNATLHWAACRLREMLDQGAPEAWAAVLEQAGVAAGLGQVEVCDTVASGLGRAER
jgi:hypothetical protein